MNPCRRSRARTRPETCIENYFAMNWFVWVSFRGVGCEAVAGELCAAALLLRVNACARRRSRHTQMYPVAVRGVNGLHARARTHANAKLLAHAEYWSILSPSSISAADSEAESRPSRPLFSVAGTRLAK